MRPTAPARQASRARAPAPWDGFRRPAGAELAAGRIRVPYSTGVEGASSRVRVRPGVPRGAPRPPPDAQVQGGVGLRVQVHAQVFPAPQPLPAVRPGWLCGGARRPAPPAPGRPAGGPGRRVAVVRRRPGEHQVLAALPDRPRQRRRPRGRLEVGVGRRPVRPGTPAGGAPEPPGAQRHRRREDRRSERGPADGGRRALRRDAARPVGGDRRGNRPNALGPRPEGLRVGHPGHDARVQQPGAGPLGRGPRRPCPLRHGRRVPRRR